MIKFSAAAVRTAATLTAATLTALPALSAAPALALAPASASGPMALLDDPVQHAVSSPTNTAASKTVVVRCPDGTAVLGAGGAVGRSGDAVILTGVVPDPALATVTVTALARPDQVQPWSLTAVAVCQPPGDRAPRLVAGAAGAAGTATAVCHDGEVVYGLGFRIVGADGSLL